MPWRLAECRPSPIPRAAYIGGMAYQQPLGPDEQEYRTEQASGDVAPDGDPPEPGSATRGEVARPWLVVGLVLLAVFVALLVFAVVLPALR